MPDPFWETAREDGSRVIHMADHVIGVAVPTGMADGVPTGWRIRGTDLEGPLLRPLALDLCGRASQLFAMSKDETKTYVRKPQDIVVRRDRVGRAFWSVISPRLELALPIDEVLVTIDGLSGHVSEAA